MDIDLDKLVVVNNEARHRFQIAHEGQVAELTYRREGDRIRYIHTIVPPEFEGHGIAGKLAQHALDFARAEHLGVVPQCPYVASYIERHPEYADLVVPG
jgi:uncharacterized protein